MAEAILEHFHVDTLSAEQGGMGVPEVVEAKRFTYRRSYCWHPEPASVSLTGLDNESHEQLEQDTSLVEKVCSERGIQLYTPYRWTDPGSQGRTLDPAEIATLDREIIRESSVVIALLRNASFGVGWEVANAASEGAPTVLLIPDSSPVSRLLLGSSPSATFPVWYDSQDVMVADLGGALDLAIGSSAPDQPESSDPGRIVEAIRGATADLVELMARNPSLMYELPPRRFEELVAELLSREGRYVELTATTRDGGYDVFAVTKDSGSGLESAWVVECKRNSAHNKVGIEVVRALYGTEARLKGANAMLATTSSFTRGARDYAAARYNLTLRDFENLSAWLSRQSASTHGTDRILGNRGGG